MGRCGVRGSGIEPRCWARSSRCRIAWSGRPRRTRRASGNVDFGHTPSLLPISSDGIHPLSGIFFANLVDANNSSDGQRLYTAADSDAFVGATEYLNQTIRAYAGETTVFAITPLGKVMLLISLVPPRIRPAFR